LLLQYAFKNFTEKTDVKKLVDNSTHLMNTMFKNWGDISNAPGTRYFPTEKICAYTILRDQADINFKPFEKQLLNP